VNQTPDETALLQQCKLEVEARLVAACARVLPLLNRDFETVCSLRDTWVVSGTELHVQPTGKAFLSKLCGDLHRYMAEVQIGKAEPDPQVLCLRAGCQESAHATCVVLACEKRHSGVRKCNEAGRWQCSAVLLLDELLSDGVTTRDPGRRMTT